MRGGQSKRKSMLERQRAERRLAKKRRKPLPEQIARTWAKQYE